MCQIEVYSRVVGYFTPISNWNQGKKQEFSERFGHNIAVSNDIEFIKDT